MSEWTPEGVRQYERAIKASQRQETLRAKRRDKWLNDFIDGKPVKQFDDYLAHNKASRRHANLECPECATLCTPRRELKNGGASYLCKNIEGHGNTSPLLFRIDGDGNVDW